jgi:hypothetical protein
MEFFMGEPADAQNLLGLTVKFYVKQIQKLRVQVERIRIMAFVVDDCLETDVISSRCDTDATDRHVVLRKPSAEVHVIV